MSDHLPRAFVEAVARRDFGALAATLAPSVRFRALLPGGPTEGHGPDDVLERYRGWFETVEEMAVLDATTDEIGDRRRFSMRIRVRRPAAATTDVISQDAIIDVGDAGIEVIDLVCSGFRPEPVVAAGGEHHFDAGDMGCADGLSDEFRRRIRGIPIGDVLAVVTSDASAKEDLPSLARLMGNSVRSIEPTPDGRLLVKVERGR